MEYDEKVPIIYGAFFALFICLGVFAAQKSKKAKEAAAAAAAEAAAEPEETPLTTKE